MQFSTSAVVQYIFQMLDVQSYVSHCVFTVLGSWQCMCVGVSLFSFSLSREVTVPFAAATITAVGTGVYLNKVVAKVTPHRHLCPHHTIYSLLISQHNMFTCESLFLTLQHFSPHSLVARLVPFVAVAAANSINIPLMRYKYMFNMTYPKGGRTSKGQLCLTSAVMNIA